MSFSINSLTAVSGKINQMQANYGVRNQKGASASQLLSMGSGMPATQTAMQTSATTGMSKSEFNASIVANSLDKLNSNPQTKTAKSQSDTYNLTKEVVGGYLNVIA
jgi:hypothetical protein